MNARLRPARRQPTCVAATRRSHSSWALARRMTGSPPTPICTAQSLRSLAKLRLATSPLGPPQGSHAQSAHFVAEFPQHPFPTCLCRCLATPTALPIIARFPFGPFRGIDGGEGGCDHHGKPVRLADHEARGRDPRCAGHRLRSKNHFRPPHSRPTPCLHQGGQGAGLQNHHRRRRRRRAPARRDGSADPASGLRRADRIEGAIGRRLALFHRTDAARCPGRDACHRARGRNQRRAARRERACAQRCRTGQAARRLASAPGRTPGPWGARAVALRWRIGGLRYIEDIGRKRNDACRFSSATTMSTRPSRR